MRKFIFTIIFISIAINVMANDNISSIKLKKIAINYLKTSHKTEHVTAISISICKNNLTPVNVTAGIMGFKDNRPIAQNSLFQVGSITKSFIVVVLLQLANNPYYHFSINDNVGKWFPEYPSWKHITIKQLMNMTSGIPNYSSDKKVIDLYRCNPRSYISMKQLVESEKNQPLLFTPGTKFNYSNTNYTLLGLLIKKVSKLEPEMAIKAHIIDRLHLQNTYFITNLPQEKVLSKRLIHGYSYSYGGKFNSIFPNLTDVSQYSLSIFNTAGAIISNTSDLNIYVQALHNSNMLLNDKQRKLLTTFVDINSGHQISNFTKEGAIGYGLGIEAIYRHKQVLYFYGGDTQGFRVLYIYNPHNHTSVIIGVNSGPNPQWSEMEIAESLYF